MSDNFASIAASDAYRMMTAERLQSAHRAVVTAEEALEAAIGTEGEAAARADWQKAMSKMATLIRSGGDSLTVYA